MRRQQAHHLASLCALLDVHYEFLLLLFELGAFTIQLALSLSEGALVLSQPFRRRNGPTKKSLLNKLWLAKT